jgi:hypothetical protein
MTHAKSAKKGCFPQRVDNLGPVAEFLYRRIKRESNSYPEEGVISVKVERLAPLREAYAAETVDVTDAEVRSHDFH